jgi:hypothetical protein
MTSSLVIYVSPIRIVTIMPLYGSPLHSPLGYLIGCFILFPSSVISTVVFLNPSHFGLRSAVLAFGISQVLQFQMNMDRINENNVINGIVTQFLWVYVMRSFDLLLFRQAYFPSEGVVKIPSTLGEESAVRQAEGKAKQTSRASTVLRFRQSFYLFFTLRDVGTPYAVKNIPPFSTSNPTWIPSRAAFLRRHIIIAVIGYLVADIPSIMPPIDPQLAAQMSLPVFSRLLHISFEEAITRFTLTALSWVAGMATLSYFHSSLAILFVGSRLSEPRFWPPQFGSLKDSHSLRGWWG